MREIKALLFDLDGTILDTYEIGYSLHYATARLMNIKPPAKKKWDIHWGKRWSKFIKSIWPDVDVDEFKKIFIENGYSELPLPFVSNALSTLYFLKNNKYYIGTITNRKKESTERICKNLGIKLNLFDYVQCRDDYSVCKPYPKVFKPVIKELAQQGIKRKEIAYVGDTLFDWYASKNAGINFFAVLTGGKTAAEFMNAGVSGLNIVDSIKDIPSLLVKEKA